MATYTAPTTRTTGALISASIWNTDIVENLKYFKDSPVFDGDISVGDDIFLTSTGAVINFASGDVTLTHSTNTLTFAGASSGYIFNDGNVGLGVTPSAWDSTRRVLQIGGSGALWTNTSGMGFLFLSNNSYYDGTNHKYLNTDEASYYAQNTGGDHIFVTAASGTAGTNVAFGEKFRILNGGNIAIGATAKLYLDGVAGTGDTYITETASNVLRIYAGGVDTIICQSDGFYLGVMPTTATAANMVYNTGTARVERSTSSIRYKHDIATLDTTDALSAVMAMRPVTYRGRTDADQRRHVGFIAEEMQQWAPLLCTYDDGGESGTPNYVTYDRVTAYLVAVVQQQQAEINALKARIH